MSDSQPRTCPPTRPSAGPHTRSHAGPPHARPPVRHFSEGPARATSAGTAWLASAAPAPERVLDVWSSRPDAPLALPCGTVFDVISAPAVFGRRMTDRLWTDGPGSGPVATHRGRMLLFAARGAAQRLPALLGWEEWSSAVPPLICHGRGDAVTVPPPAMAPAASRWLVAPDVRHPWLPGAEVLLWACLRAVRGGAGAAGRPGTAAVPALVTG